MKGLWLNPRIHRTVTIDFLLLREVIATVRSEILFWIWKLLISRLGNVCGMKVQKGKIGILFLLYYSFYKEIEICVRIIWSHSPYHWFTFLIFLDIFLILLSRNIISKNVSMRKDECPNFYIWNVKILFRCLI